MELDILCTPSFTPDESEAIDNIASELGIAREEVIRKAVKYFAAQCVPTQDKEAGTPAA